MVERTAGLPDAGFPIIGSEVSNHGSAQPCHFAHTDLSASHGEALAGSEGKAGNEKEAHLLPVERAAAVYQREFCPRPFREDLEAHLLGGWVASTPDAFAMARPVPTTADFADLMNPWVIWPLVECDAWLIYLAAGDLGKLGQWLPAPLPFIGWERRGVFRWHLWERVAKLI